MTVIAVVACWSLVRHLPEKEAGADPTTGRPQEVQSVALDGHGNLPIVALRAVLSTHAGDQLDSKKLEQDRASLEATLVARGYLHANVKAAEVMFDAGRSAYVMFSIAQGPLFHVRSVTVSGAAQRDTGVVTIATGDIMMQDRVERARGALADRLAARGKSVAVTTNVVTDDTAASVDVELAAH
jgi:outer membrane protein assembly factor BamA